MVSKVKKDVSLQLRIRSSTESVKELEEITTMVVELLQEKLQLHLVEKNINLNKAADKTLVTVSSSLESD